MTEPLTLDLAALTPVVAGLGLAAPVVSTPLAGGGSQVFRLDLADGRAVVLKTYTDFSAEWLAKERRASEALHGFILPTPRFLLVDDSKTVLPLTYAIITHVTGTTAISFKDQPDFADLLRQMGAALRQLHMVRLDAFDVTGPDGTAQCATHTEFVTRQAAGTLAHFREFGADPALADRLEALIGERLYLSEPSAGPIFAHNDFHPGNLLAERGTDGKLRLTALVDFGSMMASDALSDLAKTLFICQHDVPGSGPAIRDGYGPIGHPEPEAALWFHTLLHRVTMWWWLRRAGVIAEGEHSALIDSLSAMVEEADMDGKAG